MKGAGCFTSIDLASGFTQLEIAQQDKHKAAFPDTTVHYGSLTDADLD